MRWPDCRRWRSSLLPADPGVPWGENTVTAEEATGTVAAAGAGAGELFSGAVASVVSPKLCSLSGVSLLPPERKLATHTTRRIRTITVKTPSAVSAASIRVDFFFSASMASGSFSA